MALELDSANSDSASYAREVNNLSVAIASIDQALTANQSLRTKVGNSLQVLDQREQTNFDGLIRLETQESELQDLDFAEAVSRLNLQTVALQAAQQSTSRFRDSLFNFLR